MLTSFQPKRRFQLHCTLHFGARILITYSNLYIRFRTLYSNHLVSITNSIRVSALLAHDNKMLHIIINHK